MPSVQLSEGLKKSTNDSKFYKCTINIRSLTERTNIKSRVCIREKWFLTVWWYFTDSFAQWCWSNKTLNEWTKKNEHKSLNTDAERSWGINQGRPIKRPFKKNINSSIGPYSGISITLLSSSKVLRDHLSFRIQKKCPELRSCCWLLDSHIFFLPQFQALMTFPPPVVFTLKTPLGLWALARSPEMSSQGLVPKYGRLWPFTCKKGKIYDMLTHPDWQLIHHI